MRKLSNWIKKNILNEKQTENAERNEKKICEINKEKTKEKIYISHMDELFWEAGKFIIEQNKGSIGMIQWRFKIGFNRAARIIDELHEAGVVGEEIRTEPRKILMTYDEFEELWINDGIRESDKPKEYKELEKTENLKEYIYPPLALLRNGIEPIKSEGFSISFREIIICKNFIDSENLSFAIGKSIDRKAVVSNILDFPQIIIPDNTKSGRAACLNSMIMSFVYKTHPNAVRMLLIDTGSEILNTYNGIPHLLIPVVTDIQKSFAALKWVISECDNRYKYFKDLGVENIDEYNLSEKIQYKMPVILVFVNSFTDLISEHGEQIEELVNNITQSASKTGIYPIITETNFNCSISVGRNVEHKKKFIVVPSMDLMRNDNKSTFVQGTYVSKEEIFNVVNFLKVQFENQTKKITESKEQCFEKSSRIDMYNNKIDYMTGEDFELYVAQILGRIGFSNIQTTKGSGDQGVDILAEKDGIKYAFQCKRYDKPVGNKAVQEVFAGKFFYHCHAAIVVTNNYFTKSAKDLAHENGVVLWDRDYLQNIADYTSEYFDVKHETRKDINKDELNRILKEIALKIYNIFLSFNIKTSITDVNYGIDETEFCIQPPQGVRIKTVLSYKQEIEFELKIPIQMRAITEKGYIGIFVSSKDLERCIKENKHKENANQNNEGDWKDFEEYHEQLAQVLLDLGKIYVNLFNENLNIKTYIADMQRIDEKTSKFILRCANIEQAKVIKETEEILNQSINAEHKIEVINDKDVSVLVSFK